MVTSGDWLRGAFTPHKSKAQCHNVRCRTRQQIK